MNHIVFSILTLLNVIVKHFQLVKLRNESSPAALKKCELTQLEDNLCFNSQIVKTMHYFKFKF